MKYKKIYYNYVIGNRLNELEILNDNEREYFPDDYFEHPIPALKSIDKSYTFSQCPAWKEYFKNTWILNQSFPLQFQYIHEDKYIVSNLSQEQFDKFFLINDWWQDGKHPVVEFGYSFCFWTEDRDVWVEQFPIPEMTRSGLEIIPGSFPISVWERPLKIAFKVLDYDKKIIIDKGAPLCYVRFSSKKTRDVKFTLEKKSIPKKVLKNQLQHLRLKFWHKNYSWELIEKRLNKESKCPINFLRKKS